MEGKLPVLNEAKRRDVFGDFGHKEIGGGRIQIDADWVRANVVSCRLPRANGEGEDVVTCCHRKVKEPLETAFSEVMERGLWRLIRSFDGLWVPRHKTWNPARALSSHSWGIAFDLNASTNPYGGGVSVENRALNAVFHRYGFAWGGDWKGAKDAMHWEMAELDATGHLKAAPPQPRLIVALRHGPSFSYHVVPDTQISGKTFSLEAALLRPLLGLPPSHQNDLAPNKYLSGRSTLHNAFQSAELKVLKYSDHLDDAHDPRYYAFVEVLNASQVGTTK